MEGTGEMHKLKLNFPAENHTSYYDNALLTTIMVKCCALEYIYVTAPEFKSSKMFLHFTGKEKRGI